MKKFGFVSFIVFLTFGFIAGCRFQEVGSIQGSGNVKSETRNLANFKEINASNAITLEITAQKDFALTIEADDNLLEHIKTEVSGGTLTISTKDKISSKNKIKVKVSMPELVDLNLSGASTAEVSGVKTDSLKLNANGASKINIGGEVKSLDAIASGASGINAENLKTENAKANSSGASSVTVSPTGDLDADASGASTIIYTNEPKNIKQNSSGVSSIKKK